MQPGGHRFEPGILHQLSLAIASESQAIVGVSVWRNAFNGVARFGRAVGANEFER